VVCQLFRLRPKLDNPRPQPVARKCNASFKVHFQSTADCQVTSTLDYVLLINAPLYSTPA
jgi:hypothetical protein